MKPETLLRLYPRAWRERYGEEFLALIGGRGLSLGHSLDVAVGAIVEWTNHPRHGNLIVAIMIATVAELTGKLLQRVTEPPDHAAVGSTILLAIIAVCYALYRTNAWLFERTPTFGPRAFGVAVSLAFIGGAIQSWITMRNLGGLLSWLPIIRNPALFWTWLVCTARPRVEKHEA
jgi:hypothetical protein